MTEKLYLADADLRIFDATVQAVNDDLVELDKTAFYVTGGGLTPRHRAAQVEQHRGLGRRCSHR